MRRLLLTFILIFSGMVLFAQQKPAKSQYLLIVRFKSNFMPPSPDAVEKNIRRWQQYMEDLAQNGTISAAYRPGNEGLTLTGTGQSEKNGPYTGNNELVSSIILISVANIEEAKAVARRCPVFEFNGSVEIRPVTSTID